MMAVLALLYHDVIKRNERHLSGFQGADADIYKLDPDEFGRHLQGILRVDSLTVSPNGEFRTSAFERCYVTIDDGGSGAWNAADLLEQFGLRGYFFIVTDLIGKPAFLNEPQIVAIHRRGHTVGSHTCSHPARISSCSLEQMQQEWSASVRRLSDLLRAPVTTASVPAGFYSRQLAVEASRAGIRTLFTSEPVTSLKMVEQCTIVGRFSVQEGVASEWVAEVMSGSVLPRMKRYLWWNMKKGLKVAGGKVWLRARRNVLAARAGMHR